MTISRGQMNRQLYEGGGIMSLSKEGIGGGSIKGVDMGSRIGFFNPFKAAKKAVKKVTKAVKKIGSSDIGKAALAYGLTAGLGSLGAGAARSGTGFGIFSPGNVLKNLAASGTNIAGALGFGKSPLIDSANTELQMLKRAGQLDSSIFGGVKKALSGNVSKLATLGAVSAFLTKTAGMSPEQAEEAVESDPSTYLELYYRNLNPPTADTNSEEYEKQVRDFVAANTSEYAQGGRIGFNQGTLGRGLGSLIDEKMDDKMIVIVQFDEDGKPMMVEVPKSSLPPDLIDDEYIKRIERAEGDTASENAMQAAGIEGLPIRQNPKGVKELDLRENGGFIPPVGIKEKEDDIPAMLSNNEFVFTADAVRGMGDGNVDLGAQRMYDMMKKLEGKVVNV